MLWTVRLGGLLAAVALLPISLRMPARLLEPGFLVMFGSFAGVVALRYRPTLPYRLRALGFCALVFACGTAALERLGIVPGPIIVCAFVVVAARLFIGTAAMLAALGASTLAILGAGLTRGAPALATDAESFGAWFWLRMALGFAMPAASMAMIVAHVVERVEQAVAVSSEALRRSTLAEAEREAAKDALSKTEEALLRAQKLEVVGRLAAGVGHDFNNTLQVMLSWASILREERDEHTFDEGLTAIERAALQGRELTQRLLEFGRRDVRAPVRSSPVELMQQSAGSLRRLLPEDIVIELDVDPDAPPLLVDPAQLAHVLLNLGVNARDAMPSGGVLRMEVASLDASELPGRAGASPLSGQLVRMSVRDTGVGMTEETQRHLFEPFYTTKGQHGTGLGLATAYSIVQRNGGFIRVESAHGRGSSFHVYFPAQPGAMEAPIRARQDLPRGAKAVVMVAEDDDGVRRTIVRVLDAAGYRVLESADAPSALALIERSGADVDLLCTDGVMPGGGTREVIDRYRAQRPNGRVIVCSGYVQEELLRRDLDAGTYAYLPKPFRAAELLEKVDRLLAAT